MAFSAELLRKKLKDEGKRRADLAAATNRHVRTVSRWLTGENPPKPKDLESIARALDCMPQDFDPHYAGEGAGEVPIHAYISVASHNAYEVMRWRYGVNRKQIVELAPVLFAIVAGHALKVPDQDDALAREARRLGLPDPGPQERDIHRNASAARKCFGLKPEDPSRNPRNLFCEAVLRLSSNIEDQVDTGWFVGAAPGDVPTVAGYIPDTEILDKITGGDSRLVEAIVKGRIRLSTLLKQFQGRRDGISAEEIAAAISKERDNKIEEQRKAGLEKLKAWRAYYAERHPDLAQEYDDLVADHCHKEGWYPDHYTDDDRAQCWINPYEEDRHINENTLLEYQQRLAEARIKDEEETRKTGLKSVSIAFDLLGHWNDPVNRRFEELNDHRAQLKKQFEEEAWT